MVPSALRWPLPVVVSTCCSMPACMLISLLQWEAAAVLGCFPVRLRALAGGPTT